MNQGIEDLLALMLKRSSRVMPGFLGTPAGMTTRSQPYSASDSFSAPVALLTCMKQTWHHHPVHAAILCMPPALWMNRCSQGLPACQLQLWAHSASDSLCEVRPPARHDYGWLSLSILYQLRW